MIDHDFVGHLSPRTGTAMDRVRRAGLKPDIVFENVGRAYSPEQAEGGFHRQPGPPRQPAAIRAPAGIGVVVVFGPEVTGARPCSSPSSSPADGNGRDQHRRAGGHSDEGARAGRRQAGERGAASRRRARRG